MKQETSVPQLQKAQVSPNQTMPSTSNFHPSEPADLLRAKTIIQQALEAYQVQEIRKLLVKVGEQDRVKEMIAELAFAEWQLKEKQFSSCDCCQCSCEPCQAMDKGDDMVYMHLKDFPYAYNKSEARIAWEWVCYSIALPCLCLLVVPVLAYAGSCYCRGCLPNICRCGCPNGERRDEQARKELNRQLINKLRKLQQQCKAYL